MFSQETTGHSIAARSREMTVGMKIDLPRYRATAMLSKMTAFSPQRVAVLTFMSITMDSFVRWGRHSCLP